MINRQIVVAIGWLALLVATPKAIAQPDPESIGSTRNSVVATPERPVGDDGQPQPLVYLTTETDEGELAQLRAAAPGVEIISGIDRRSAMEHASRAHGADAHLLSPEFLENAPNLAWAQSHSAGVERYIALDALVENDSVVLTNMRAAHGPAIADHSFAMLLSLTRDIRAFDDAKDKRNWDRNAFTRTPIALQGRTMLVVGLGGIGSEIAQRAHGFGMRVIATRRSGAPGPEWIEHVGRPDELMDLLPQADVVALAVPLTPETEHMLDAEAFSVMKEGAYLINIARGRVVDTDAMLDALRSGRLAGACLDVTDPEPLPANHPLWREPNVVITPHIASRAGLTTERAFALFLENMRRFDAGEPLLNVVDKDAGY